jgi:chorismate dehydratase
MQRVATVSYLNALPLVDGIDELQDVVVTPAVPSELLAILAAGGADIALCPVIDFQQAEEALEIVPVGAIGCDGPALTVKLFSAVPVEQLDEIAVDGESHTSVALLRIIMRALYDRDPKIRTLPAGAPPKAAEAMLLIGDKVVTSTPDPVRYRHRLDLGAAWKQLSPHPFVFATWMTLAGAELGELPRRLEEIRRRNRSRISDIARRHAAASGWPTDLAVTYLRQTLRYRLADAELAGIRDFWRRCRELGIIDELRPMKLHPGGE